MILAAKFGLALWVNLACLPIPLDVQIAPGLQANPSTCWPMPSYRCDRPHRPRLVPDVHVLEDAGERPLRNSPLKWTHERSNPDPKKRSSRRRPIRGFVARVQPPHARVTPTIAALSPTRYARPKAGA